MTVKQKISQQAEVFAREVIEQEFKQTASNEMIEAVAKKLSRAMPLKIIAKMDRKREVA